MGVAILSAMIPVVLIVEDVDLIRVLIVDYLKDVGFEVIEAVNGAHALAVIDQTERIDAVFTDVHMPGNMDGHALAGWLQRHWPDVPVLITSGIDVPKIGSSGRHRRFIAKPYALSEVERHIRELLH
jgi:CheY-like chemotaxis protein